MRIIADVDSLKAEMIRLLKAQIDSVLETIDVYSIELPDVVRRDAVGEILCAQKFTRNRDGLEIAAKIGKLSAWTGKRKGHDSQ